MDYASAVVELETIVEEMTRLKRGTPQSLMAHIHGWRDRIRALLAPEDADAPETEA